jgi:hypothetical protein
MMAFPDELDIFRTEQETAHVRQRILTTNINLDEGACDIDLVVSVAEYFGLASVAAKAISRALRLDQEKGPPTQIQRPPYHSALIPGTRELTAGKWLGKDKHGLATAILTKRNSVAISTAQKAQKCQNGP